MTFSCPSTRDIGWPTAFWTAVFWGAAGSSIGDPGIRRLRRRRWRVGGAIAVNVLAGAVLLLGIGYALTWTVDGVVRH
ncbi:MAG TPA: hypothetical protein VGH72_19355, partial [Pseudonocardia sp.]